MSKEQIEVGTVLTFDGVENLTETIKTIQDALSSIAGVFKNGKAIVTVDDKALKNLADLTNSLATFLSEVRTILKKPIKIEIDDNSIKKMKDQLENIFAEVLSRTRTAPTGATGKGNSSSKVSKPMDVSETVKEVQNYERDISTAYQNITISISELLKSEGEQIKQLGRYVGREVLQGIGTFRIETAKEFQKGLKDIQKDSARTIAEISRQISLKEAAITEMVSEDGESPLVNNLRAEIHTLEEERRAINEIVGTTEIWRQSTSDLITSQQNLLKIEEKLQVRQGSINRLFTEAGGSLQEMMDTEDISRLSTFTDRWRKLGLQITLDIKTFQAESDKLSNIIRGNQNRLEDLNSSLLSSLGNRSSYNKLLEKELLLSEQEQFQLIDLDTALKKLNLRLAEQEKVRAGLNTKGAQDFQDLKIKKTQQEIASLNKQRDAVIENLEMRETEIASLREAISVENLAIETSEKLVSATEKTIQSDIKAKKTLEDKIQQYHSWGSEVKNVMEFLRLNERVFAEELKMVERAQRNYQRLEFSVKSFGSTLNEVFDRVSSGQSSDLDLSAVKKVIGDIDRLAKASVKSLGDLEAAQQSTLSKINRDFETRSGLFANFGMDEAGQEAALEFRNSFIRSQNKYFGELISHQRAKLDELNAIRSGEKFLFLESFVDATTEVNKLDDGIDKLIKKIQNLDIRNISLANNPPNTSQGIIAQADLVNKLESEYKQVNKEVFTLQAEMERLRLEGVADLSALETKLKELLNVRKNLQTSMSSTSGNRGEVLFNADLFQKGSDALEKYSRDIISTQANLRSSMIRLGEGGDGAMQAAQDIKKLGSESKSAYSNIQKFIALYEDFERRNGTLSADQRVTLEGLRLQARAFREVALSVDKNKESLDRAEKSYRSLGQRFTLYNAQVADSIRQSFSFVNAMTVMSTVLFSIRGSFSEIIQESRAFSRTMTVMESSVMTFGETFDKLKYTVREVAVDMGETISDVAEVAKQIGSAGFTAEEALRALAPTMKLVVATSVDSEVAARAVVGIYRIFGDQIKANVGEAKAFARINDVLSSVYKNHTAEIDELAAGLKFSSSAAKLAGFSFEENAAFLAVLNDNMIKSGEAGRGLQVIFAQLAAKSDKFSQLFNVDIDKNAPLRNQFLTVLKEVNKQVATGELSVKELEKRFEIFGLRGARSFAVLTEKYKDVEKAFDELNNKATGLTDTLAGIVTGELDKQFQSAKQALLDFARDGAEPLKDIVVGMSDLIKAVRDFYSAFELLGGKGTVIAVFSVAMLLAIQTGIALSKVLATMFMEMKALGLGTAGLAKDMYTAVTASRAFTMQSRRNAVEMNYLTASTLTASAATDKYSKANAGGVKTSKDLAMASASSAIVTGGLTKGIGALAMRVVSLAGPIFMIISAVSLVIGLFSSWNDSTRELNRDLGTLANEVKLNTDEIKKMETFKIELDKISKAMDSTAISADGVGQSVKNAFDKVGPTLVSQSEIIGKTNKEIAESFRIIRIEAERQANLMTYLKEQENLKKRNEMVSNLNKQLIQDFRLAPSITDSLFGGDSLKDRIAEFERYEKILQVIGRNNIVSSSISMKDYQAERTKVGKSLEEDVQKFADIKSKLVDALGPQEAAKEVDKLYKIVGDRAGKDAEKFIRERINQIESTFKNSINIPSVFPRDAMEETAGVMYEVVSLLDAPIQPKVFDGIREGMRVVKDEAERARKEILSLNKITELRQKTAFFEALNPQDQKQFRESFYEAEATRYVYSLGSLQKVMQNVVMNGMNDNKERQALFKDLSDRGIINRIDPKVVIGINEVNKATEEMFANFAIGGDLYEVSGTTILGVTDLLSQSTKDAAKDVYELSKAYINLFAEANVEEKLKELDKFYQTLANSFKSAVLAQTNLNDVISKRLQIEQFRQLKIVTDDIGKNIPELTRRLAEALKLRGSFVDQLADKDLDIQSKDKASEEIKQLDARINDLKQRLQLEADYIKAVKELAILNKKNENTTIRQLRLQQQITSNFQSSLALKYDEIRINAQNLQLKIQEDIIEERLKSDRLASLQALNEYIGLQNEIIKNTYEILSAETESAKMRFDTLADIDQLLDKDNKLAGAQYKIVGALTQVADINRRLNNLQGRGIQNDNDKIKLYRELVDVAKDVFAIQDLMKKNEEKMNDLLNKRAELLKKIRDEYGSQATKFEEDLKKVLSNRFDSDSLDTALKLAKALNINYKDVFSRPEKAIEDFVKGVKSGRLDIRAFGEDLGFMGDKFKELSDSQEDYNRRFLDVQSAIRGKSLLDFERFLALNKFDEAEKALDRYTKSLEDGFKDKNPQQYLEGLEKSLEMQERLSRKIGEENQAIKLQFELIGDKNVLMFFDEFRNRLKLVKQDLLEWSNLKNENIPGLIRGELSSEDMGWFRDKKGFLEIKAELRSLEDSFYNIARLMARYGLITDRNFTSASGSLPKYKDGGFIPGYGGGDKVMALLEQGEFVIPKEMVKKYGMSFFENLRHGNLPKFQNGGAVQVNNASSGETEVIFDLGEDTVEALDAATYDLRIAGEQINLAVKDLKTDFVKKLKTEVGEYLSKTAEKIAIQNPSALGLANTISEIPSKIRDRLARDEKTRSTQKTVVPVDRLTSISDTAKKLREEMEKNPLEKFMFEGIMDGIDKVKDYFTSFLNELFVPEFAKANAEVYQQFLDTNKEIQKTYEESFNSAITGLKRNETAYYDYLNAVEDAENERTKARMEAEEEYRKSLIKTSEVFRDSLVSGVNQAFNVLGSYSDKFFTAASESLFGSMEDNAIITFSFIKQGLGEALGGAVGGLGELTGISGSEGLGDIKSFFTEGTSGAIAQSVGSIIGSSIASMSSLIVGSLGQLVSFTSGGGDANNIVKFIEKFAEELPEKANEFINTMIENAHLIVESIAENAPTIVQTFAEKLPDLLEGIIKLLSEALPKILGAIAKSLPTLIRGLIPQLMSLLGLVIEQVPTIIEAIASSIPLIIGELIKALPKLIPSIIVAIVKGVVALVWGLIRGIVGVFGLDLPALTFHKGGVIPGNRNDMLINAQSGEGVLSRQGLAALGGPNTLYQLNKGINPYMTYHNGGIVSDNTYSTPTPSNNYNTTNNNSSSSNSSTTLVINMNGGDSDAEIERKAKIAAVVVDKELAKMKADRRSRLTKR